MEDIVFRERNFTKNYKRKHDQYHKNWLLENNQKRFRL